MMHSDKFANVSPSFDSTTLKAMIDNKAASGGDYMKYTFKGTLFQLAETLSEIFDDVICHVGNAVMVRHEGKQCMVACNGYVTAWRPIPMAHRQIPATGTKHVPISQRQIPQMEPTTPTETYVAVEPEETTSYMDAYGNPHETRDAALEATFNIDFEIAVNTTANHVISDNVPNVVLCELIKTFAKRHPDMLRILIGDREYT